MADNLDAWRHFMRVHDEPPYTYADHHQERYTYQYLNRQQPKINRIQLKFKKRRVDAEN